jgi:ubiquinone/menaquinone biosynthesis C-methylase UbiE
VTDYLHGYSDEERARLQRQAQVLSPFVHRNLPFADRHRLLEVGCGTGAQLELLLDGFPGLHVTGVDRAADQLAAAAHNLAGHAARTRLVEAPAERLPFEDGAFDAGFLCWILEHVAAPATVLGELHRVLAPGAPVVITEVMNATFHLVPPSPHTMRYWSAFNRQQQALRGDPYVGARLGHYLHHAGFRAIETTAREVIFDDRDPAARAAFLRYCKDLLLSAAPSLLAADLVDRAGIDAMSDELEVIGRGPGSVFFYAFVQARCVR